MFSNEKYFREMSKRLESTFEILFKIGIVTLTVLTVFRFLFISDDSFKYVTISLLAVFIFMHVIKKHVSIGLRVKMTVFGSLIAGLFALYNYGVSGTGVGVLIVANIVMAMLGENNMFYGVAFTSVIGYILVIFLRQSPDLLTNALHLIIMISCIYLVRMAMVSIRRAFVKNIKELDYNLKENELMIKDLSEQHDELKESKIEIYELAYYDQLTGLPNKNNFRNYVNHRLGDIESASMMMLDIKDFKLLNSVHGSKVGDQLLRILADVIRSFEDSFSYTCRVGGNEFVFWYESTDKEMMMQKLDEFILEFNVRLRQFMNYTQIKFRIAYVQYPYDGTSYTELYDHLNIAQKYQKSIQSEKLVKYEVFMKEELHAENTLKDLIEDAIQRRSFEVYYQEKIDCVTNRVIGLETLARWHSDDLGHVTPDEFIPVIKKYKMVESFERLIIGKVFSDYHRLLKKYGQINISMNISSEHILLEHFMDYFSDAMMMYRINPENISLEITEDIIEYGTDYMNHRLQDLRSYGVKIALDNFGANKSALNYVARLPIDEIKIDRQFIHDIENIKMQQILKTILEMKDALDVRIVAEGVENERQLEILKQLGCTEIQGFLFQRPSPIENLNATLENNMDIC